MARYLFLFSFLIFSGFVSPAYAYIGPGMAGGVVATVIGILAAFVLALFGILYYPIKRAIKSRKRKPPAPEAKPVSDDQAQAKTEN